MDSITKRKKVIRQERGELTDGGWLWSAFWGGWLWALAMRNIYAFLISLIAGVFGNIFLGFFGRELAVSTRKFDNKEHFLAVQKQWQKWGAVAFIINIGTMLLLYIMIVGAVREYQPSVQNERQNEGVIDIKEDDINREPFIPIGNQPTLGGSDRGIDDTLLMQE